MQEHIDGRCADQQVAYEDEWEKGGQNGIEP